MPECLADSLGANDKVLVKEIEPQSTHIRTHASNKLEPDLEAEVELSEVPFRLEAGGALERVAIRYAIYGRLNKERSDAVLVCHALSGSARVADWWPEMFGTAGLWDLDRTCVVGTNILGSCYGSTGPSSIDPQTGRGYGANFPLITVRDVVRAQALALQQLGIQRLKAVIGGSVGGMQALQWAVDFPEYVDLAISIAAAPLSAMGLALNHLQRQAIQLDPIYNVGQTPARGLELARAIAMCSYKSADLFDERHGRRANCNGKQLEEPLRSIQERFDIAGYLDHQGSKFAARFDADSYMVISKAMDTFDLGRGFESETAACQRIRCPVLLVGISSDWLFPAHDVLGLADRMRDAGVHCCYRELASNHGHDAFLADAPKLASLLREHL